MGIKGIYKEIGPGERQSLFKIAVEHLEQKGRPFRLAIDISIWQFQAQAAKGGSNPAARTLFYRLVRLLGHAIDPIFVFDGPSKPAFKRNRSTAAGFCRGGDKATTKRLIRLFGFTAHDAPGEAEAECALLQRMGIVDAVLSEDVDTIMFGCTMTLRNWSADTKGGKTPTHVSVYDAALLRQSESGLDREGMVLVALMSGGDYIPEGVPGCGVKVACEAAKAGFGQELCKIKSADTSALSAWRERLVHELRTNENGFFRTRHKALTIPESFPRMDVLRYYTHPVVSKQVTLERLKEEYPSKAPIDVPALREIVQDVFDWTYKVGAVKLIRVLAPSMLSHHLTTGSARLTPTAGKADSTVLTGITSRRSHFSMDGMPELRVSYVPIELVKIDLEAEPQEIIPAFGRDGLALNSDDEFEEEAGEVEGGPDGHAAAARGKNTFDPLQPSLAWIPEHMVRLGAPLTIEDWEEKQRAREQRNNSKTTKKCKTKMTGTTAGALDKWLTLSKPVERLTQPKSLEVLSITSSPLATTRLTPTAQAKYTIPEGASGINASSQDPHTPSRRSKKPTTRCKAAIDVASTRSTNPWTIAGSQFSPRTTKPATLAIATQPKRPPAPDPILITSSPSKPSPSPDHPTGLKSKRPAASTSSTSSQSSSTSEGATSPSRKPQKQRSSSARVRRTKNVPMIITNSRSTAEERFPAPLTQMSIKQFGVLSERKRYGMRAKGGRKEEPIELPSSDIEDGAGRPSPATVTVTVTVPPGSLEDEDPFQDLPTLEGATAVDGNEISSSNRSNVQKRLYVPRSSDTGFFKEVEVSVEEAERLCAAGRVPRGSRGAVLRYSDVSIVDLTAPGQT